MTPCTDIDLDSHVPACDPTIRPHCQWQKTRHQGLPHVNVTSGREPSFWLKKTALAVRLACSLCSCSRHRSPVFRSAAPVPLASGPVLGSQRRPRGHSWDRWWRTLLSRGCRECFSWAEMGMKGGKWQGMELAGGAGENWGSVTVLGKKFPVVVPVWEKG